MSKLSNLGIVVLGIMSKLSNLGIVVLGIVIITVLLLYVPLEYRLLIVISCLLPFGAIALIVGLMVSKFSDKAGQEKKSIIFQVPINHKWVLRNVWRANPKTLEGYQEKSEGWRFYIPTIWHSDEGLVNLAPKQFDPQYFTVNCTDGNDVEIDTRITYFVRQEKEAAKRFVINKGNEDINNLVLQRTKVALNRAMDYDSRTVIEWGAGDKVRYSDEASKKANLLLKNDGASIRKEATTRKEATAKTEQKLNGDGTIEKEATYHDDADEKEATYHDDAEYNEDGKDYGLQVVINIENVKPTPAVRAATDRAKAAKIEKDAAPDEAGAMKIMIEETGANPTLVMIAQSITDTLRGIFGEGRKK